MNRPPTEGVIPALLSLFDEQRRFDYDGFARHIDYLAGEGAHGVFLAGTTGEGAYLTSEERIKAIETVTRIAGDRVTIYAVVLRPGTPAVIDELQSLKGTEVSYAAAVTPFYMSVSQDEVEAHYREIADNSPLPFLLYNIPQNTANRIEVDTAIRLAQHPNIFGIKDSSGDFLAYTHGILTCKKSFTWIQGEDRLDAPSFMLGARAIVTGLGNVDIRPYVRMFRAAQNNDWEEVKECQRRINALATIIGAAEGKVIQAIKSGTAIRGRAGHAMRVPAMDLSPTLISRVRETLDTLGLDRS